MSGVIREWDGTKWVDRLGEGGISVEAQAALDTKEPVIAAGSTSQFWRGDKTWQVPPVPKFGGLGDVTLTNPADFQTLRYDATNQVWVNATPAVDLTSSQTVTGAKYFTQPVSTPGVQGDLTNAGLSLQDQNGVERAKVDTTGLNVTAGGLFDNGSRAFSDWNRAGVVVCRAGTTPAGGNITLSGTQIIDGVSLAVGDLVLVKDQITTSQQGVWQVSAGAWSRAPGLTTAAQVAASGVTNVSTGTVNGGTTWSTTFKATNTLNSAPMPWWQIIAANDIARLYQPIKVDSGWVTITPTAGDAPFAAAAATVLRYRKIDNRVELQLQKDSTASFAPADANFAPDINVFATGIIPTAIRNPSGQPNPVATARFGDAPVSVVMTGAGAILMVGGVPRTYASGSTLYATASWYLD